jgi:hypothetical protein
MDGVITDFSDIHSASPSQKSPCLLQGKGDNERYNLSVGVTLEGAASFIKSAAFSQYLWHTSFPAA